MPMKITSEFWQELIARQRDRKVTITRILGVISPTLVIIASLRNLNLNFTFWSFMIVASICLILINLVLLILKR